MLPCNHASNFRAEWWNDRRKRDYFVDQDGLVQLRPESPTGMRLREMLMQKLREIALRYMQPMGSA